MADLRSSNSLWQALAMLAIAGTAFAADKPGTSVSAGPSSGGHIERGRYLVKIAGCNDCHTAGYAMSGGKVPEKEWLLGDALGWRGPWGTTYPANLRLSMTRISEEEWLRIAQTTQFRPPMPWFALRDMSKDDLRAIYRYVRHLGASGKPAPDYLPPDQVPQGPFIQFPEPPRQ